MTTQRSGYQSPMRRLLTVVLAASLAALSACGTEDISPEAIADAAKATAASGGSAIAVEIRMAGPEDEITMVGDGVIDTAGRHARIDYALAGDLGASADIKQIIDGNVLYMQMSTIDDLPDGKSWIKFDMSKAAESVGLDAAQLDQLGSDATRTLDYLRATGDVEKEGEEEVRGIETTHYRAVVDLRKYPELVPESERAQAARAIETLIEQIGESEVPTDVWIDDRNLVRRMRQQLDVRQAGQDPTEMDITTELFDFGTPVSVSPPPESEVFDATDVAAEELEREAP